MWEALIVMIPMKETEETDPHAYRPLSMLGVDAKILAKIMATRLRTVVTPLVSEDQCGFMPG